MAWIYGDLQQEILNEVDDNTTDAATVVDQFINDVMEDIWYFATWSFRSTSAQFSSVSGTAGYDLSSEISDLNTITTVGYKGENETTFRLLQEIDIQTYNDRKGSSTDTGSPIAYAYYNDTLYLYPTPNYSGTNNMEIFYDKQFTLLAATSDIPQVPYKYRRVVKAGVKALFWNYDDDLREAIENQRYEKGLGWMMEDNLDRTLFPKGGRLAVSQTPRGRNRR